MLEVSLFLTQCSVAVRAGVLQECVQRALVLPLCRWMRIFPTVKTFCSAMQSRPRPRAHCARSCACCQQDFGTAVPDTEIPTRLSRGVTWLSASAARGKVCGPRGGAVEPEPAMIVAVVAVVQAPRSRPPLQHDAEYGSPSRLENSARMQRPPRPPTPPPNLIGVGRAGRS